MLREDAMFLGVLSTERENWQAIVREQVASGRNFFLVLPPGPEPVRHFCAEFGLRPDCLPAPISRADFLRISQHVNSEGFGEVLQAFANQRQIIFLEQLDFEFNRPPQVQRFVVYSPIFGILSHHPSYLEGMKALAAYNNMNYSHPPRPKAEAALYRWDGRRWILED